MKSWKNFLNFLTWHTLSKIGQARDGDLFLVARGFLWSKPEIQEEVKALW